MLKLTQAEVAAVERDLTKLAETIDAISDSLIARSVNPPVRAEFALVALLAHADSDLKSAVALLGSLRALLAEERRN